MGRMVSEEVDKNLCYKMLIVLKIVFTSSWITCCSCKMIFSLVVNSQAYEEC